MKNTRSLFHFNENNNRFSFLKKSLIALGLICYSFNSSSQIITPYKDELPVVKNRNRQTQWTYYDMNYVAENIQTYFYDTFGVRGQELKIKENKGVFTFYKTFERVSNSNAQRKIVFAFNVFPVEHLFVVKSVDITGDKSFMYAFFASYWSTAIKLKTGDKLAECNLFQDVVSLYSGKNGTARITVRNQSINDFPAFEKLAKEKIKRYNDRPTASDLQKKLSDSLWRLKIEADKEQARATLIKRQQDSIASAKYWAQNQEETERLRVFEASKKTELLYDFGLVKTDDKFKFDPEQTKELEAFVREDMKSEHSGIYRIRPYALYEEGKIKTYRLKVLYFQAKTKKKGLF